MTAKRISLIVLAVLLLAVAFVFLFPATALPLIACWGHMCTVGLSMDDKAKLVTAVIGGAAAMAGFYVLGRTLRSKH